MMNVNNFVNHSQKIILSDLVTKTKHILPSISSSLRNLEVQNIMYKQTNAHSASNILMASSLWHGL